jgi:hypothetical protein
MNIYKNKFFQWGEKKKKVGMGNNRVALIEVGRRNGKKFETRGALI